MLITIIPTTRNRMIIITEMLLFSTVDNVEALTAKGRRIFFMGSGCEDKSGTPRTEKVNRYHYYREETTGYRQPILYLCCK